MNQLEDMKAMWLELNQRISSLEEENRRLAKRAMENNYKSAKEKLLRKYSFFIGLELFMIIFIIPNIIFNPEAVEKYKMVTVIYWCIFFAFELGIDIYLRYRIKIIDIYNSNITEIAAMAAQNWKIHKIAICIGLPIAIGAVILFGLLLGANKFVIYGMITGGVIGMAIGFMQLLKFREYYRMLQSNE